MTQCCESWCRLLNPAPPPEGGKCHTVVIVMLSLNTPGRTQGEGIGWWSQPPTSNGRKGGNHTKWKFMGKQLAFFAQVLELLSQQGYCADRSNHSCESRMHIENVMSRKQQQQRQHSMAGLCATGNMAGYWVSSEAMGLLCVFRLDFYLAFLPERMGPKMADNNRSKTNTC